MQVTDVVADMLTRIRNANSAKHETVDVPASNLKKAIAQILLDEGYIKAFELIEDNKPGLKIYAASADIPKVRNGLGIAIISTSKGIMTDKKARSEHVGGEVLAFVW